MGEYKFVKKKFDKKNIKSKNKLLTLLNTVLVTVLLFVTCLILSKTNKDFKNWIYDNIYSHNFSFAKIEETIKKYLGNILPINDKTDLLAVSKEIQQYESIEEIENGIRLKVKKNENVIGLESGIVVFAGDKDNIKNLIIIEQIDGKEAWYANVDTTLVKIYDYIEKGQIITNTLDTELLLYFKDDGKTVDYKEYIF